MEMLQLLEQLQAEAAAGDPDAAAFLPTFADWVLHHVREQKRLAVQATLPSMH